MSQCPQLKKTTATTTTATTATTTHGLFVIIFPSKINARL
jgi:hypothetical protein